MKKIYKILSMLLLVAAIVCVAGCSSKNSANTTQSTVAENNITESTAAANVPANTEVTETPTENATEAPTENMTATPTENVTVTPTENVTDNTSVPTVAANGTHLNSVQRHQQVAQQQAQQQQSSSSLAVTP